MGIPKYFRYVRTTMPQIISAYALPAAATARAGRDSESPSSADGGCDHLLLDFNCAVHTCARVVTESLERGSDEDREMTTSQVEGLVIEESCAFVELLVQRVRPRRGVFVAIDGVPPRSKMVQQRNRRYLALWAQARQPAKSSVRAAWSSNCVTPGTEFMGRLAARLKQRMAAFQSRSSGTPVIEVSDAEEAGEGEQKIYARLRSGACARDAVVYGLDADLLILSGLCCESDETDLTLRVLRPADGATPAVHQDQYHMIDVNAYRAAVHARMRCASAADSMREYATLCSLLGNDFVPGLAGLPVCGESIELLVRAHQDATRRCAGPLARLESARDGATDQTRIRIAFDVLERLMEILAEDEDARVRAADAEYYASCDTQRRRDVLDIERYPLTNPFPNLVRPAEPGWRPRYYHHLLGADGAGVSRACRAFVQAVEWSINYHCQLPVDFGWFYPFSYAPTALDVANFLAADALLGQRSKTFLAVEALDAVNSDDSVGTADSVAKQGWVSPPVQLMMVLPPESIERYVRPRWPWLADLTTSIEGGCAHLFPTDFAALTYLKRYVSECLPRLPDLDCRALAAKCEAASAAAAAAAQKRRRSGPRRSRQPHASRSASASASASALDRSERLERSERHPL